LIPARYGYQTGNATEATNDRSLEKQIPWRKGGGVGRNKQRTSGQLKKKKDRKKIRRQLRAGTAAFLLIFATKKESTIDWESFPKTNDRLCGRKHKKHE
jgi:hypothetical protein